MKFKYHIKQSFDLSLGDWNSCLIVLDLNFITIHSISFFMNGQEKFRAISCKWIYYISQPARMLISVILLPLAYLWNRLSVDLILLVDASMSKLLNKIDCFFFYYYWLIEIIVVLEFLLLFFFFFSYIRIHKSIQTLVKSQCWCLTLLLPVPVLQGFPIGVWFHGWNLCLGD